MKPFPSHHNDRLWLWGGFRSCLTFSIVVNHAVVTLVTNSLLFSSSPKILFSKLYQYKNWCICLSFFNSFAPRTKISKRLNQFWLMSTFDTSWKHQKTKGSGVFRAFKMLILGRNALRKIYFHTTATPQSSTKPEVFWCFQGNKKHEAFITFFKVFHSNTEKTQLSFPYSKKYFMRF